MNGLGLGIELTARDLTRSGFASANKGLSGLQGGINKFAMSAAKAFAGVMASIGTMKLALGSTKPFAEFEQGLATVGGVLRASSEDMAALKDAAIKAGIETQFSPKEATDGLNNLASAGFNARESISLLNPALNLAAAGQLTIAQSSSTMASTMKVFGLSMDDAGMATDKLLRISNLTALKAVDLENAIGGVSRGAGVTQQSLDEMLVSMGLVKNSGVDASVAASSVSSALMFMADKSKDFKALGINVTDAAGNFRPLIDIVLEADTALSKQFPDAAKRTSKALDLFGKFGLTAFSNISGQAKTGIKTASGELLKGAAAVDYLRNQMKAAGGAAEEFKGRLLNTFSGQQTLLKGSMQTLAITAGEALAGAFRPYVEKVTEFVNQIIGAIQKMDPELKETIGKVAAAAAGFITIASAAYAVVSAFALVSSMSIPAIAAIAAFGLQSATAAGFVDQTSFAVYGISSVVSQVGDMIRGFLEGAWAGLVAEIKANKQVFLDLDRALGNLAIAFRNIMPDATSAKRSGESFGHTIGKVLVLAAKLVTVLIDFVTQLMPIADAALKVVDALGGLSTIVWILVGRFVILRSIAIASWFASVAMAIPAAIAAIQGFVVWSTIAVAIKWGQMASAATAAFSAVQVGLAKLAIAAPFIAAAIAIGAAIYQLVKLKEELGATGWQEMYDQFMHDTGKISDKEFSRRLSVRTGMKEGWVSETPEEKRRWEFQHAIDLERTGRGAGRGVGWREVEGMPGPPVIKPAQAFVPPTPTAAVGQALVAGAPSAEAVTSAATTAAVAAAKAQPPSIARAMLNVDGKVLGEVLAQFKRDIANAGSAPVEVTGY